MTGLVQRAQQRVNRFIKKYKAESSARRFVAYCRRKWPQREAAQYESVVLVSYFAHKISTFCNAHAANYLARTTGSGIETFAIFGGNNPIVRSVYNGFGAQLGLDGSFAEESRATLREQAGKIFAGLRTKWQLLELRHDGLKIGDLVYDTYLRSYNEPTVKLEDPRLHELIFQSLFIFTATVNYLKTRKVTAMITDDFCYHECGIITRLMVREHVPVYMVCFGAKYFIYRLTEEAESGFSDFPIRWPYHRYREVFQSLPASEQEQGAATGRKYLEDKLSGLADKLTLGDISAYGASGQRIFTDSGKPRILVMLHDFIDAPHGFRWMLFPDFYDWIYFLLEKASETPFEWYIKPHPSSWDPTRGGINRTNVVVVEELLARFPKVKIIQPTVSNRQIIEEGVAAMFTMYGTAGHEFARLGIPVVNAGDNPHFAYDFNYHPTSVEQYADLIQRADRLTCEANHRDIDEYCFMNYFYYRGYLGDGSNPMPKEFFAAPDYETKAAKPDGYDLLCFTKDPAREASIERYYREFFGKHHPQIAAMPS